MGQLPAGDPRIDDILRRAPPRAAERLLRAVLERRPLAELSPVVRRVLASDDRAAASEVLEDLFLCRPEGYEDLIARALANGAVHPDVEESARFIAGEPSEAELYWQDAPDDDDE